MAGRVLARNKGELSDGDSTNYRLIKEMGASFSLQNLNIRKEAHLPGVAKSSSSQTFFKPMIYKEFFYSSFDTAL